MVSTERVKRSTGGQPDLRDLLAVLDAELAHVFAFVLRRCGDRALAEDLSVSEVAAALGRSVHATESLLVRARQAFRARYLEQTDG